MSNARRRFNTDDDTLDRLDAAYQSEYARWCCRRKINKDGYELVRNSSPENNINADEYFEIINLTKRDAQSYGDAEMWLVTYRGRAAMKAVLEAL